MGGNVAEFIAWCDHLRPIHSGFHQDIIALYLTACQEASTRPKRPCTTAKSWSLPEKSRWCAAPARSQASPLKSRSPAPCHHKLPLQDKGGLAFILSSSCGRCTRSWMASPFLNYLSCLKPLTGRWNTFDAGLPDCSDLGVFTRKSVYKPVPVVVRLTDFRLNHDDQSINTRKFQL